MASRLMINKHCLLKEPKSALIVALALIAFIIAVVAPNFGGKSFEIEDKCGKFINLASHTIEDNDACKTRCRAQCQSIELGYKKAEFKQNNSGCNYCRCYCK